MPEHGRLFVVNGDLTKIDCDAVLVPVDAGLNVTAAWKDLVGRPPGGRIPDVAFDGARVVRYKPGERRDGRPRVPEVWLGDFGRGGADDEWYVDGLLEFVRTARRRRSTRRLGINVVGTGQGGRRAEKGSLFTSIVTKMDEAARQHRVDIVLVCWGDKPYTAAQRARREAPPSPSPDEHATRVARLAQDRELVLFLGAGVSMGAGLSSWDGLLRDVAKGAPKPSGNYDDLAALDARDQAAIISTWFPSPAAFGRALREHISSTGRYSLSHALLAGLGTRENVTTNYDTLFEAALATPDRGCDVLPYQRARAGRTWLLKLHGSVDQTSDLVLTRGDYLSLPGRSSALFGLLQAMLMTKHMLFVGYSLTDDSFHRVMHEVRTVVGKPRGDDRFGTAVLLFRDPNVEKLWGDLLHIVTVNQRKAPDVTDRAAWSEGGRQLEMWLDDVCLAAADSSPFLMDCTYDGLLDGHERELRTRIGELRESTRAGGPIDEQLRRALSTFG